MSTSTKSALATDLEPTDVLAHQGPRTADSRSVEDVECPHVVDRAHDCPCDGECASAWDLQSTAPDERYSICFRWYRPGTATSASSKLNVNGLTNDLAVLGRIFRMG